jgi:hypothetical protein
VMVPVVRAEPTATMMLLPAVTALVVVMLTDVPVVDAVPRLCTKVIVA